MSTVTTTTTTDDDGDDPAPADDATYAAFYIENLRTGATRQIGYVTAATAAAMRRDSTAPHRLMFTRI